MSSNRILIQHFQIVSEKLDKLIEIQERPYKEQEMLLVAKKKEKMREYITDLIDPSHYE